MVVTGSWVIIIVWVVQDVMNKAKTEMMMQKYDSSDLDKLSENINKL
jgi:preprotein translocase subunit SecY